MSKRDSHGYWVMQVPVISEGHLTEEVFDEMMKTLPGEDFHGALCMIGSHGAMVYCDDIETLPETAPDCLRTTLAWGKGEGFDWVRYDPDGDVIDGLELHEW